MPGTFAAVIRQFTASPGYLSKAESTRRNWGRALRRAEEEGGLGGCSVQVIKPSLIQSFLDALSETPGNQSIARSALKALEGFALVRDLVPYPFMTGTSVVGSDGGFEPWSDAQVELAEQHARPDLARIVTLAVHTGQRGSDIVRMCPTDIEERVDPTTSVRRPGINVTQKKTGKQLWIPFTSEFASIITTWERRPGPFVLKPDGTPFTRGQLSWNWNYERDTNEALKPISDAQLVIHGLRATAVVRARKKGLTDLQIGNFYGMSVPMVSRYSRLADQGEMAMAAVHFLDRSAEQTREQTVKKFKGLGS